MKNVDGQTDRQTDVGHINLIGGLVTRNPPKKHILWQNGWQIKDWLCERQI